MSKPISALMPLDFEPLDGETFTLAAPGGELAVKLIEVRRLGAALRDGGAFSLVFTSPPGPALAQGTYPLKHAALGTLEVFVVPLGPKNGLNQYQVIFT
jgi:hypothetical protein